VRIAALLGHGSIFPHPDWQDEGVRQVLDDHPAERVARSSAANRNCVTACIKTSTLAAASVTELKDQASLP
jgi:hypothetical protein